MQKVIMYSLDCEHCRTLKKRFNELGIAYEICDDIEIMRKNKFNEVPIVEADGKFMKFGEAMEWANNQ